MQKYFNSLIDSRGNAIEGVSVRVYVAGSQTLASLYSDDGVTPTTNPQITDALGYFSFYVITGNYDFKISGPRVSTYWVRDVLISDEVADYASPLGATLIGTPTGTVQADLDARPTAVDLADATDAAKGSGRIGFNAALAYASGTIGRWLKDLATSTGSSLIGFLQAGTGAWLRTLQDKLRDSASLNDFGAIGDGSPHALSTRFATLAAAQAVYPFVTDLTDEIDWAATQAAINAARVVRIPDGKTYILNRTVYENTNGGARSLVGAWGHKKSQFQLRSGVTGIAAFHFGNNNGHGSYRLRAQNVFINDPGGIAAGNTGIIAQECGNSHFSNIFGTGLAQGVHLVSSTDVVFDGRQEFATCGIGINGTAPTTIKTTQPPTDINVTTVFSPNNDVRIKNGWFSGGNKAIYIEGDLVEISGCCCQSVGSDGTQHLIEVNNTVFSGASFKGPNIHGNWVEGGQYKYFIATIKARGGDIYDNYIVGKGSADAPTGVEGGIFVDSTHTTVRENRAFQYFARTTQDGRLANAAIYVTSYAQSTVNVHDNTLQRSQTGNQYYFEGRAAPTLSNSTRAAAWGHVAVAAAVGTLSNGANITGLVQFSGTGTWQVNFAINFESLTCPVFITPISATPLIVSYAWNGAASVRIRFHNAAGTLTDPDGFSIQVLGERVVN